MDSLLRDLRYALRTLRKSPGFTTFAALTLALGIGATSTIFSVVNAVLLTPLPFQEPDRVVSVYETNVRDANLEFPVAPANFLDWRTTNSVFTGIAASRTQPLNLTGPELEPERLIGASVTWEYFDVLGATPRLGRTFTSEEDAVGAPRAVILSDGLWRRRFDAATGIVGQAITLNGQSHIVVGVMAPSVRMPSELTEFWVPMAFTEQESANRGAHFLSVLARLKPGMTVQGARAEMQAIASRLAAEHPVQQGFSATVVPLGEDLVGDSRTPLLILSGAVAFVLLICCANVANLMLARAAGRQKEIAIRSAIGAGRRHIVRQLLAESAVLAVLGGIAGLLLATWSVDLLARLGSTQLPRLHELAVNGRVVGFAMVVSLLTGMIFGVIPAFQASRTDLNETLKDGTKGSSGGPARSRARQALLVAEVAISLTLLVGAGLMLRSMNELRSVDPGFQPRGLVTGTISLPALQYDTPQRRAGFFAAVEERLVASPDVRGIGFVTALPLSTARSALGYWIEGVTPRNDNSQLPIANYYAIAGDYFGTMEIPLRRGRLFSAADDADAPQVAIVNETLVRQHFGGEDPIGRRVQFGPDSSPYVEIVGIVGDVRHAGLGEAAPPQMYVPYAQDGAQALTAVVRARDAAAAATALRREVRAVDANQPVARIRTMEEVISQGIARPTFITALLGSFAAVALVLALVGIYGVVSYSVAQRTQEFGIRMALGADARRVVLEVVSGAARVTAIGIAIGVVAALFVSRVLGSLLFQVRSSDPLTYAVIASLLVAVALLASYVPARRATRVTPLSALRNE